VNFFASFFEAVGIVAVQQPNDSLTAFKVVAPQRPYLILTSDVPDCELYVLVLDRLDVET